MRAQPPSAATGSLEYPYLARFANRSGKVAWSPEKLRDATVPTAFRPAILASATVEGATRQELLKASRAGLMRHEDLRQFFELWIVEEEEHARVLRFVAQQNGWDDFEDQHARSRRQRIRHRASPVGLYCSRLLPDAATAILGVGAAAEYVTHTLYRGLARAVEHGELKRCLFRIAAQESNHMRFFVAAASARPSRGGAQAALVRTALKRTWQPVGMDRLGEAAWNLTFQSILSETSIREELAQMDEMLNAIEVFSGLELMSDFLSRRAPVS